MIYNSNQWYDWHPILKLSSIDIPSGPGVYVIATRTRIARVGGKDPDGILDIGESQRLRHRINTFVRCADGSMDFGHAAGSRYHRLQFRQLYPLNKLWLTWRETTSKRLAYKIEGDLLSEYVNIYRELPPLNYKYNLSNGHVGS